MKLSAVTSKYIGRPDMGCLDLCVAVLRDLGLDMPAEVDGLGVENYRALADRSMRLAESELLRRMWKVGRPGSTRFPRLGDFIAVLLPGGGVFPAVALGGGLALASFVRDGVRVFRIDAANRCILCRRLPREKDVDSFARAPVDPENGPTGKRANGQTPPGVA
jgi:hypothetical protein